MKRNRLVAVLALMVMIAAAGALPRMGGTAAEEPELRLVLNIPAYRLDVYESGRKTRSFMVSVGSPGHQTPAGTYDISTVVWNPWWHPPKSEWARDRKPTAPGLENPMGRVKLNFAPLYYIHGTPLKRSLGQPSSHGCIRMRNEEVQALARLVHAYASPDVTAEALDRLEASPKQTRNIRLRQPVPLEVRYDVVELEQERLHIHRDVYGKTASQLRREVVSVLAEAGYAESELDPDRIEEVVAMGRRQPVIVPVSNLLVAPSISPVAAGGGVR